VLLDHSPCLRSVDLKLVDGRINMTVYFRSWGLWAGFPTNLGGLQLLNEYIASETGTESGKIFVSSSGLHIYSMYLNMVQRRLGVNT
jgi:thymidylate synthase